MFGLNRIVYLATLSLRCNVEFLYCLSVEECACVVLCKIFFHKFLEQIFRSWACIDGCHVKLSYMKYSNLDLELNLSFFV